MSRALTMWHQLSRALGLGGIRRKIVAFALIATVVPSLSMGWLSYRNNRNVLDDKLEQQLTNASAQAARELDLWLKERLYEVRVFASSYEISENLGRRRGRQPGSGDELAQPMRDYLASVHEKFTDYIALAVTDASGQVVAASPRGMTELGAPSDVIAESRESVGPLLSRVNGRLVILLSEPVRTPEQKHLGHLAAVLDAELLTALLAQWRTQSGDVLLVDRAGAVVATSGSPRKSAGEPQFTLTSSLLERPNELRHFTAGDRSMVGAVARLETSDWATVAQIETQQAYAAVKRLRNFTLMLMSFVVLVVGVAGSALAMAIVRPLERLTRGAYRIAAGDLDVDLPVGGDSEIAYLTKVFNQMVREVRRGRDELAATNHKLLEQNLKLHELSMVDGLTGLYNRTHMKNTLVREFENARRHSQKLAILMTDVDHFKKYNDRFGHLDGDEVLRRVASIFDECLRQGDYVARYGGEEFLVLLPQTPVERAVDVAERIRLRFARESFGKGDRSLTLSVGVAVFPADGVQPETVIASADAALYEAKRGGRNQVRASESAETEGGSSAVGAG